jgi:hypothetical protein
MQIMRGYTSDLLQKSSGDSPKGLSFTSVLDFLVEALFLLDEVLKSRALVSWCLHVLGEIVPGVLSSLLSLSPLELEPHCCCAVL